MNVNILGEFRDSSVKMGNGISEMSVSLLKLLDSGLTGRKFRFKLGASSSGGIELSSKVITVIGEMGDLVSESGVSITQLMNLSLEIVNSNHVVIAFHSGLVELVGDVSNVSIEMSNHTESMHVSSGSPFFYD